jgi:OmpA-OmpF porin, OOP family
MHIRTPVLAAAALAALIAGGPAAAQNSGWYLGGGLGNAKADFTRGDFASLAAGTYSADDTDAAARIFGGYRIAPNWGVEFGLASLGRYKHRYVGASGTAVYTYDASAATVAMAANLPLAAGVSMNGRAGAAFTAARMQGPSITGSISTSSTCFSVFFDDCTSTSTNFFWGLGVQFDINPRWGMRLDYDNYGEVGEQLETGRAKIDAWSANVLFRF